MLNGMHRKSDTQPGVRGKNEQANCELVRTTIDKRIAPPRSSTQAADVTLHYCVGSPQRHPGGSEQAWRGAARRIRSPSFCACAPQRKGKTVGKLHSRVSSEIKWHLPCPYQRRFACATSRLGFSCSPAFIRRSNSNSAVDAQDTRVGDSAGHRNALTKHPITNDSIPR
jgi:hypothetical protein